MSLIEGVLGQCIGGSIEGGGALDGPISFTFLQFPAEILPNGRFCPKLRGCPPPPLPLRNSGSATTVRFHVGEWGCTVRSRCHRVPTWTGKMGRHFPVRESQGILNRLEKSGKITQNTGKLSEKCYELFFLIFKLTVYYLLKWRKFSN